MPYWHRKSNVLLVRYASMFRLQVFPRKLAAWLLRSGFQRSCPPFSGDSQRFYGTRPCLRTTLAATLSPSRFLHTGISPALSKRGTSTKTDQVQVQRVSRHSYFE